MGKRVCYLCCPSHTLIFLYSPPSQGLETRSLWSPGSSPVLPMGGIFTKSRGRREPVGDSRWQPHGQWDCEVLRCCSHSRKAWALLQIWTVRADRLCKYLHQDGPTPTALFLMVLLKIQNPRTPMPDWFSSNYSPHLGQGRFRYPQWHIHQPRFSGGKILCTKAN